MTAFVEADVEDAALEWLADLGWQTARGPDIGPDGPREERTDYGVALLERRLRDALARLNPDLPVGELDDAYRKLTRPDGSTLETRNGAFHRMLVEGSPSSTAPMAARSAALGRPPSTAATRAPTTSSRSPGSP